MPKLAYYLMGLMMPLLFITADTPNLDNITTRLQKYAEQFPQEKVYVHTDRDQYAQGEIVWLKSYLTAGAYNQPSPISNNIHIELYSPQKSVVSSLLLRSEEGFAEGHMELPEDLSSGSYLLRAYTSWMLNFDNTFLFEKEITILDYNNGIQAVPSTNSGEIDLTFFPEGGNLVAGVAGRIAFKAIKPSGLSAVVSGTLYDNSGTEKLKFESSHDGMGFFAITPEAGKGYYVVLDGSETRFQLPKVQSQGFSVSANNNLKDVLRLTFRTNNETCERDELYVVIHSGGIISYAFPLEITENIAFKNLSKKIMPHGISHITMFDGAGVPLLERLVFIEKDLHNISIETDKEVYGTRDKVKAKVKITDKQNQPVQANFSLAALDMNQTGGKTPTQTIESNLLLTSDLHGYIENPAYYFQESNPDRKKHLDLVMMTHGWRRFKWEDVMDEKFPEITHLIEKGFTVGGHLVDKFNGKPIPNGSVTFFDNSQVPPFIEKVKTDENGHWVVPNIMAYNNKPITLQGKNKRGKKLVSFKLDTAKTYQTPESWINTTQVDPEEESLTSFLEQSKERQLIDDAYDFDTTATVVEGVVVEGNRFSAEQNRSIYGAGSNSFGFERLTQATLQGRNPVEILQGRIPGVRITGQGPSMQINIRGSTSQLGQSLSPLILLNDIPTDIQTILFTPASDIERVEVFKGPDAAVFGAQGAGGAIAFYTFQGRPGGRKPPEGLYTTILADAYQGKREFYAPKYEVKLPEHIKPDQRVLLHWQPMGVTDENGVAEIEFWTSDLETIIGFDLQGLTLKGQPVVAKGEVQVEKQD